MRNSTNQSSKSVTIFQVASAAGVSYGTVSRVINDDPHVKAETRGRVRMVMDSLGYVVDRKARSLAGGHSHVIAVMAPDLGTGYIGEIMRGIDAELSQAGYDMMLYTTHRREVTEQRFIATIAQGLAEGTLLILPRNPGTYLESLRARNFPFVLIDHQGIDNQGPAVGATKDRKSVV
jgi:LacI family transcriptional regulator